MELPYLKNKNKDGGGGPTMVKHADTTGDTMSDDELMDHVAQEMIDAIGKKDVKSFRAALHALVNHIQDMDKMQDEGE